MTHASPTDWIGRSETVADRLDPALAERVRVTLGGAPLTQNDPLPHLWQWAFFQNPVANHLYILLRRVYRQFLHLFLMLLAQA